MERLEWTALEYEGKERDRDWFWALGIIVITSSLAAIIYSNYFFAVLIVLGGTLLGFFAKKKPDMVSYELSERGLRIRTSLYPFENIKSFWVQVGHHEESGGKDILFIKSARLFLPILTIPINSSLAEEIKSIMLAKDIAEEEMREHVSEKILEHLGF